jgi:outer membrane protein TolC
MQDRKRPNKQSYLNARVFMIRIPALKCIYALGILLCVNTNLKGQQTDSVSRKELSEAQFLAIIRNYHPYLEQARLTIEQANSTVLESRGSFDPVLQTSFDRKTFDDKLYYSYFNPEVVIPTWYGIEVYAGVENILGERTDVERTLGKTSYLGISVPLARDLVLDKRRAILQQAKVVQQQSRVEQVAIVNDLLFDALSAYWNWVKEYQVYNLLKNSVSLNKDRFRFIRIEAMQGSRPPIDTIESLAQLQQFQFMESDAYLRFQQAGLALSDFLWVKGKEVFPWDGSIIPDTSWLQQKAWNRPMPPLEDMLNRVATMHPKMKSYALKNDWLAIERKLKFQDLLPKADLKYNLLNKGYNVFNKVDGAFLENNYKIGFNLQMPLLLRQGRGAYQQTNNKIRQLELQMDQTRLEIENKLRGYYNEVFTISRQIELYESTFNNYQKLFIGEDLRFRMGESTLFLLNARENKALEALQKLLELKTKWFKSNAALTWSEGRLEFVN